MAKYIITSDSAADLHDEFFEKNPIDKIAMPYSMGDVEYNVERFLTYPEFYAAMRAGAQFVTSQISLSEAERIFEKHLAAGLDVLHLSFSSGMSGSFENLGIIKKQLLTKYPERKIILVDTLSGAGGEGLLLYYAVKMQKEGKTMEQIAEWVEANRLNVQHFFIVEDLMHLRRGGRVSKIEALLGTILGIKPVLELNDEGRIVPIAKARGHKKAIESMCELAQKNYVEDMNDFVLIGHGDSAEMAHVLGDAIQKATGAKRIEYCYVNYLVGSHAGPSALAVFFIGKSRVR